MTEWEALTASDRRGYPNLLVLLMSDASTQSLWFVRSLAPSLARNLGPCRPVARSCCLSRGLASPLPLPLLLLLPCLLVLKPWLYSLHPPRPTSQLIMSPLQLLGVGTFTLTLIIALCAVSARYRRMVLRSIFMVKNLWLYLGVVWMWKFLCKHLVNLKKT